MNYSLVEVKDKSTAKAFIQLPVRLYRTNPYWIRPLDKDIEKVFDPAQNKLFQQGECIRWLLQSPSGEIVGRVAAFVNKKTMLADNDQPTGGMGFFECIDDRAAAHQLFDACKQWLSARGMEAMDGPINFGERDAWWGLLVEGEAPPNFGMPYHFSYYQALFTEYGFQEYFKQFTYKRIVSDNLHRIVVAKAERILNNPDYRFTTVDKKQLPKYAEDFRTIYNKAWSKHDGVAELTQEQASNLIGQMKPILDERIIYFGYFKEEPVAFYIHIPDLNQAFKFMNTGKFDLIGIAKFLWFKYFVGFDKMIGLVFGVVPEHQGRGVEAAIVEFCRRIVHLPGFPYKTMEMNWVGDFNPKMMKVAEMVGGKHEKTHITYRFLFDPAQEFKKPTVIK
jgi:GNAT superfamily N-acetyltransferase